jgi:hypothetical protein
MTAAIVGIFGWREKEREIFQGKRSLSDGQCGAGESTAAHVKLL